MKSAEEEQMDMTERGEMGAAAGGQVGGAVGQSIGAAYGGPIGAAIGEYIGKNVGSYIGDKAEDYIKDQAEENEEEQKKKGGSCSGSAPQQEQASEYPPGTSPEELGEIGADANGGGSGGSESGSENGGDGNEGGESNQNGQCDDSVNQMCKKSYTIYRALQKDYQCPTAQRDNVSDQFTPQDDLITLEKTARDFLKIEGKVYDSETSNPRFFASEGWVQHYEKDKNVVLAAVDQYKANTIKMEHLYTVVDNNSYTHLLSIPNQDCKESFQTHILWTARSLKDWANNWFIKRNSQSSTPLLDKDYWTPGLTGQMIQWMKIGTYKEFDVKPIAIETMARKVDLLEGLIDRLMNQDAVSQTISKFMNIKEVIEQDADQNKQRIFTSKVIDSQMGKKLGVTDTGVENQKVEGTSYIAPKEDKVEEFNLQNKLSCVKKLFNTLRGQSLAAMKKCRCTTPSSPGPYTDIWTRIDDLAAPLYTDMDIMNELVEDKYNDYESPGKHCSVTHAKLDPDELKKRISSIKAIIETGVVDVMTNQAMLPKKGKNVLDSMFNQLWEYGEKGPTIELPTWCQMAIDSINGFEQSMLDAWTEVYDCWEREFMTRLWDIEVDHHTSNFEITQTKYAKALHNHQHPYVPLTMMTLASIGGDSKFSFVTPVKAVKSCPGHLEKLMRPVCIQYRIFNIAHLSRHYRTDVKSLCQWMCAAIEAIGIKLSAISAVMSDPTLNGNDSSIAQLDEINSLRCKNSDLLTNVQQGYGIYNDVDNMKNKKEYDEEIALHELQPNKYSNEDQLNMGSSVQSESKETYLSAELCEGGICIEQLKPWNHLELSENHVEPKSIPAKPVCNKFDKMIKSEAGFETMFTTE